MARSTDHGLLCAIETKDPGQNLTTGGN